LSEVLRSAEAPILRRWYKEAALPSAVGAADEWAALVHERLRFVFHAAEHAALPVPEALAARILRQVDSHRYVDRERERESGRERARERKREKTSEREMCVRHVSPGALHARSTCSTDS